MSNIDMLIIIAYMLGGGFIFGRVLISYEKFREYPIAVYPFLVEGVVVALNIDNDRGFKLYQDMIERELILDEFDEDAMQGQLDALHKGIAIMLPGNKPKH